MAIVSTTDVVTNPSVSSEVSVAGKAVCSALPTGAYWSYQVEPLTDRATTFDYVATETKYENRFDGPFYYNGIDGGDA